MAKKGSSYGKILPKGVTNESIIQPFGRGEKKDKHGLLLFPVKGETWHKEPRGIVY
jgi:hypothetical protein